jgi:hypothetical protein
MNFKLYISNLNYSNFVSYLEFRLHTRQLICGNDVSYRDIDVLSQSLNPEYVKRLQLNLRPFEAMLLIVKQAISILVVYAATLATLVSAGIIIVNKSDWIIGQIQQPQMKEQLAMVILSGLDLFNKGGAIFTTHHKIITCQ